MTCESLRPWIEPFLDGELDVPTARAIGEHLASCPSCTRTFQWEREIRGLIKQGLTSGIKAPEGLWEKFKDRALHGPGPPGR
jgi:anti-sigma factor RsiW